MKTRPTLLLILAGLCIFGMGKVQAQVVNPATTDAEWEALVGSSPQQATFIRTTQDWGDYSAGAQYPGHPLNGLTSQQLSDFAASLWIVDGGVVTMDIGILRDNLSADSYANVLAAFGISPELADDHEGYECEKRATCKTMATKICMSTC